MSSSLVAIRISVSSYKASLSWKVIFGRVGLACSLAFELILRRSLPLPLLSVMVLLVVESNLVEIIQ